MRKSPTAEEAAMNLQLLARASAESSGQPSESLRQWWMATARSDLGAIEPKIGEYTALDLEIMGDVLENWTNMPVGTGAEAAVMFYVLGKVARAVAAYREGRLPSTDTLLDISVYSMMARRIRETGRWS